MKNRPYVASWEKEYTFKPDLERARTDFMPQGQYLYPPSMLHKQVRERELARQEAEDRESRKAVARPRSTQKRRPPSRPSSSHRPRTATSAPRREEMYDETIFDNDNEDLYRDAPREWTYQREVMNEMGVPHSREMQGRDPRYRKVGYFPNSPARRPRTSSPSGRASGRAENSLRTARDVYSRHAPNRAEGRRLPGPRGGNSSESDREVFFRGNAARQQSSNPQRRNPAFVGRDREFFDDRTRGPPQACDPANAVPLGVAGNTRPSHPTEVGEIPSDENYDLRHEVRFRGDDCSIGQTTRLPHYTDQSTRGRPPPRFYDDRLPPNDQEHDTKVAPFAHMADNRWSQSESQAFQPWQRDERQPPQSTSINQPWQEGQQRESWQQQGASTHQGYQWVPPPQGTSTLAHQSVPMSQSQQPWQQWQSQPPREQQPTSQYAPTGQSQPWPQPQAPQQPQPQGWQQPPLPQQGAPMLQSYQSWQQPHQPQEPQLTQGAMPYQGCQPLQWQAPPQATAPYQSWQQLPPQGASGGPHQPWPQASYPTHQEDGQKVEVYSAPLLPSTYSVERLRPNDGAPLISMKPDVVRSSIGEHVWSQSNPTATYVVNVNLPPPLAGASPEHPTATPRHDPQSMLGVRGPFGVDTMIGEVRQSADAHGPTPVPAPGPGPALYAQVPYTVPESILCSPHRSMTEPRYPQEVRQAPVPDFSTGYMRYAPGMVSAASSAEQCAQSSYSAPEQFVVHELK